MSLSSLQSKLYEEDEKQPTSCFLMHLAGLFIYL